MTVFLTPGGEPFFGGTYLPPDRRYGMPSFREVLTAIAESWRERRDKIDESAGALAEHLRSIARVQSDGDEPGEDVAAGGG